MPDYVLTSRIYFGDAENAENAFNHIKALAEHSAAHDRQIGGQPDASFARVHICYAADHGGDTSFCDTTHRFVLNEQEQGEEAVLWAPGQSYILDELCEYEGVVYKMLQPTHTTQVGWEPPNVPSIWQAV